MRLNQRSGFTIMELSIVILVIALITGIGITSSIGLIEQSKYTATENKLNAIENALMSFRQNKNRLPCPGDLTLVSSNANYGVEAANPGTCSGGTPAANNISTVVAGSPLVMEGGVPVRGLNLPDEFMYDGWGRRINYAVTVGATDYDAFSVIMPNETCGISVLDAADTARTSGAIYTLVSYGPNGHGAYLPNGTQMISGSTNASEAKNCHCDSAGVTATYLATYVQKSPTGDTAVSADVYDDLVRYKDRWQLENYDDTYNYTGYKGPNLFVGFNRAGASSSVIAYQRQCGAWSKQSDFTLAPNLMTNLPTFKTWVGFTPGNQHLFTYSFSGCFLYRIKADGNYTDLGGGVASCPDYLTYSGSIKLAMSNNGYMAISSTVSTYLFLWKLIGDRYVSLPLTSTLFKPGTAPGTVSPTAPEMLTFSKDANYMALAVSGAVSPNLIVYKRAGDTFTALGSTLQPASVPAKNISAIAFSPDGKWFALTLSSGVYYVWSIANSAGAPFSLVINGVGIAGTPIITAMQFSPDGKYLAMAGGAAGGDNIVIYKIDGTTFTALALPTGWVDAAAYGGNSIAFSPDSKYIAMTTSSAALPLAIFQRTSATTFKYIPNTYYTSIAQPGISVSFAY
jgi:type II secretory pathway pseudopilin PulG